MKPTKKAACTLTSRELAFHRYVQDQLTSGKNIVTAALAKNAAAAKKLQRIAELLGTDPADAHAVVGAFLALFDAPTQPASKRPRDALRAQAARNVAMRELNSPRKR